MSRQLHGAWVVSWVALLTLVPVGVMISRVGGFGLRDTADLFALTLGSPLSLLFPLALGLLAAGPLAIRVETRWASNIRTRTDATKFVGVRVVEAAAIGLIVGAMTVVVPAFVCFVIWPAIGNPSIDPAGYFLTPEQATLDSFTRFTYSEWLRGGPLLFIVGYGTVVGLAAASFAVLAVTAVLIVPNAYVGLALPGAAAILTTIVAALLGEPRWGIVYSVFPFGLQAVDWLQGAIPVLVLAVLALIAVGHVLVNARRLANLR